MSRPKYRLAFHQKVMDIFPKHEGLTMTVRQDPDDPANYFELRWTIQGTGYIVYEWHIKTNSLFRFTSGSLGPEDLQAIAEVTDIIESNVAVLLEQGVIALTSATCTQ